MRYSSSLLLLIFALASCDKSTSPPVASSLAAVSSVSVSGNAGVAVSPSPSVIVKDQHGSPMSGVPVTFAVTSGGGSLAGGAFTTAVTTGADGVASVSTWVLGQKVGANVLTASSGTLTSITFTASSIAGPPSEAAKVAGDNGSAVVATVLPVPPSVLVKDAFGNPVSGVNVTFAIVLGGGSLTNAARTTGADGIATVGSWTLGTVATPNTMTATAGSLAPVTFSVTAIAGPPSTVLAAVGDAVTGRAGVASRVGVRVTDSFNNGVPGKSVAFAVTRGGGTILGNSVQTTDQSGLATLNSWILGPNPGLNQLTGTLTSVGSATFTVIASSNVCAVEPVHVIGSTSTGTLSSSDCALLDGSPVHYFPIQISSAGAIEIRQASAAFDAYTYLTDASGSAVAEADDDESSTNSLMTVLVPPGNFKIGASTFEPAASGTFSITTAAVSESENNCDFFFILPGRTTTQAIGANDCVNQNDRTLHADIFVVRLGAGQATTFKMSSAGFDSYLELYSATTLGRVAQNDNANAGTLDSEIGYTPSAADYFYVVARTAVGNVTGAYTLSVNQSGSALRTGSPAGPGLPPRGLHPRKGDLSLPWNHR